MTNVLYFKSGRISLNFNVPILIKLNPLQFWFMLPIDFYWGNDKELNYKRYISLKLLIFKISLVLYTNDHHLKNKYKFAIKQF